MNLSEYLSIDLKLKYASVFLAFSIRRRSAALATCGSCPRSTDSNHRHYSRTEVKAWIWLCDKSCVNGFLSLRDIDCEAWIPLIVAVCVCVCDVCVFRLDWVRTLVVLRLVLNCVGQETCRGEGRIFSRVICACPNNVFVFSCTPKECSCAQFVNVIQMCL